MFEFIDHDTDFADLSEITFLTRENLLAYDSSLKPADVPEPEAGKIDIYSKNGYDESVFCYLGQDFAINHSFRYESEADAYLSVKNSFYVVADEATLSRMYELQIAAGANADGSGMYSLYRTEMNFEYDGTKEEKLACEDAVSKAISAHGLDDSGYLCSRTENEKGFYVLYGGLLFLRAVPWHYVSDGYGYDHFLQTDFRRV